MKIYRKRGIIHKTHALEKIVIIYKPLANDYEIKEKFALFPKKIDERRDVWSQFYFRLRRYDETLGWKFLGNFLNRELSEKFIKEDKDKRTPKVKW